MATVPNKSTSMHLLAERYVNCVSLVITVRKQLKYALCSRDGLVHFLITTDADFILTFIIIIIIIIIIRKDKFILPYA